MADDAPKFVCRFLDEFRLEVIGNAPSKKRDKIQNEKAVRLRLDDRSKLISFIAKNAKSPAFPAISTADNKLADASALVGSGSEAASSEDDYERLARLVTESLKVQVTQDDLRSNPDTAKAYALRLNEAAFWLSNGREPEAEMLSWLARPLLSFRRFEGGDIQLPVLNAALSVWTLSAPESKDSPKVAVYEAAQDWRKRAGAGNERVTMERIQLPPSFLWKGDPSLPSTALMQDLLSRQAEWFLEFLKSVFGTQNPVALAGALNDLLLALESTGNISWVRPEVTEVPDWYRNWADKNRPNPRQRMVTLDATHDAGAQDQRGLPLSAFTDNKGSVLFPVVVPAGAGAEKKVVPGLFSLPVAPMAGSWPAWRLGFKDARRKLWDEVHAPVRRSGGVQAVGGAIQPIHWNFDGPSVPPEWADSPDATPGIWNLNSSLASEMEEALDRIPRDAATRALPPALTGTDRYAWAGRRWPEVKWADVCSSHSLVEQMGGGSWSNLLSASLYVAQAGQLLGGERYRDVLGAVGAISMALSEEPDALLAWRVFSSKPDEQQFIETLDSKEKLDDRNRAPWPCRPEHWLRLREDLAGREANDPDERRTTTFRELAKKVLAQPGRERLNEVLTKNPKRLIASLVHAFAGGRDGDMFQTLSRFEQAWHHLAGLEEVNRASANGPVPFDQPREVVLREWRKKGVDGPLGISQSTWADLRSWSPQDHEAVAWKLYVQSRQGAAWATQAKLEVHGQLTLPPALAAERATPSGAEASEATTQSTLEAGQPALPTLEQLFGSMDVCACDEHESVYGAPAYLVDVLQFLRYRVVAGADFSTSQAAGACGCEVDPVNALEVLLERRPDLEHLDLNEANTTTELPYIDLVNEILEAAVLRNPMLSGTVLVAWDEEMSDEQEVPAGLVEALRNQRIDITSAAKFSLVKLPENELKRFPCRQVFLLRDRHAVLRFQRSDPCSRWSIALIRNSTYGPNVLAAEPEHESREAYELLSKSTEGLHLPFSLPEARIDEYLALVNGRRAEVAGDWAGETPSDEDRLLRAGLGVGLQFAQSKLVIGKLPEEALWKTRIGTVNTTGPGKAKLAAVMNGLELSTHDVEAWLRSTTLQGRFWLEPSRDCDTERTWLHWSDDPFLLSRCVRLKRALDWSVEDLDRAIAAPRIANGTLNLEGLESIGEVKRLAERLQMPLETVCAMFGQIPFRGYSPLEESMYWRLLLDPRVTGDDVFSEDFQLFDPDREVKGRWDRWRKPLAMRLNESAEQLDEVVLADPLTQAIRDATTPEHVKQGHLSVLWGHCHLRRALRRTWPDYLAALALYRMQGDDERPRSPLQGPATLTDFLDWLERGKRVSSLPLHQLSEVLLGQSSNGFSDSDENSDEPTDAALKAAQLAIAEALNGAEDPVAAQLARSMWCQRHSKEIAKQDVSLWWSAHGGAHDAAGLSRSCWAPIAALAEEVEALRSSVLSHSTPDLVIYTTLPSGNELKEGGRLFLCLRDLLERPKADAGEAKNQQQASEGLGKCWVELSNALGFLYQWAGLGKDAREALLNLLEDALIDRSLLSGIDASHTAPGADLELANARILFCVSAAFHARIEVTRFRKAVQATLMQISQLEGRSLEALLAKFMVGVDGVTSFADWLVQQDGQKLKGDWANVAEHVMLAPTGLSFPNTEAVKALWLVLKRFARSGTVIKSLGLSDRSVEWLLGEDPRDASLGLPDLTHLSDSTWRETLGNDNEVKELALQARAGNPGIAGQWRRLCVFVEVSKSLPERGDPKNPWKVVGFSDIVALMLAAKRAYKMRPNAGALQEGIRVAAVIWDTLSGYPAGTAWGLVARGANSAGTDELERFLRFENYLRLARHAKWLRTTGLGVGEINQLLGLHSTKEKEKASCADGIRAQVKLRFAERDWLTNVRRGSDKLREKKRDALVDWLLFKKVPGQNCNLVKRFESKNDILNHYLIDPQMSACMTTSRVVQAHAAVQMFVQRCLMGLEAQVRISDEQMIGWAPWEWMKEFRVWQAARKIFLYPENWIDHELRDDRSPFFKELQDDLNKGRLNERGVEDAVVKYLQSLNSVARLETVSMFYEFSASTRIVHIVGRTRSEPRSYYYRQWIDESEWTAWERIDLEINSEQVSVFVRNGRVYLCWLLVAVKEDTSQKPPKVDPAVTQPQPAYWELKVALSELVNGRWSSKRVGDGVLPIKPAMPVNDLRRDVVLSLSMVYQDLGHPLISIFQRDPSNVDRRVGEFNLSTCSAEVATTPDGDRRALELLPKVLRSSFSSMRFLEREYDAFLLKEGNGPEGTVVLRDNTPGAFAATIPQQFSELDFLLAVLKTVLLDGQSRVQPTVGAWLPIAFESAVEYRPLVERGHGDKAPVFDLMGLVGLARALARRPSFRTQARSLAELVQRCLYSSGSVAEVATGVGRLLEATAAMADMDDVVKIEEWLGRIDRATGTNSSHVSYPGRLTHPASCDMLQAVTGGGLKYLYYRDIQQERLHVNALELEVPDEEPYRIAYKLHDGYALYNWELFVHIPLLVAKRYASQGDFSDAMRWFERIFNVTGTSEKTGQTPDGSNREVGKYWIPRHFSETSFQQYEAQQISRLIDPRTWRNTSLTESELLELMRNLYRSVKLWRVDPRNPHQISRYRWVAFQKAVVYQFIEMLLDFGDSHFRSDTRESVNAAITLYVLAEQLLGRRPISLRSAVQRKVKNFEQIQVDVELADANLVRYAASSDGTGRSRDSSAITERTSTWSVDGTAAFTIYNDYFCVPQNTHLTALWDRVEDRLQKIRTCRNIDGVERSLALFAPPIDPAALVRSRGLGQSISQMQSELGQPLPHFRFLHVIQKARDYASQAKSFADQLLSIVEKRDSEALTQLRAKHELALLKRLSQTREAQIKEARFQTESLMVMKGGVEAKERWFRTQPEISAQEQTSLDLAAAGTLLSAQSSLASALSSAASNIPQMSLGYDVGALFYVNFGGQQISSAAAAHGHMLSLLASVAQGTSSIVGTKASYARRKNDWNFQADQSVWEGGQLKKQIEAAQERVLIAERELAYVENQISQAEAVDQFLKDKFSNVQLYDWMLKRMNSVYAQMFQLALEHAKMAQRCLDAELPPTESPRDASIIQFTYWSSGPNGLLAAEPLLGDLARLDAEWTRRSKREHEITKSVSLLKLNPWEFLKLRVMGSCTIAIGEEVFNTDFPGHARRRLKQVSLSVPCVSAPHTSVSCQLTLLNSQIRLDDEKKIVDPVPVQAICTSNGRDDTGLFEFTSRDDRYLPFEGAGAESEWRLEIPGARQFDWLSISDVVLTLRYTAQQIQPHRKPLKRSQSLLLSCRTENPSGFFPLLDGDPSKFTPISWSIPKALLEIGRPEKLSLCIVSRGTTAPLARFAGKTVTPSEEKRDSESVTNLLRYQPDVPMDELANKGVIFEIQANDSEINDIFLILEFN